MDYINKRIQRFKNSKGHRLYDFEPFLSELTYSTKESKLLDLSECDTVVVPAKEDGFKDVFIDANCWYAIRMSSTMIPRIKYIAGYQVAPVSAITHVAEVSSIEHWKDSNKYIVNFKSKAKKIKPIKIGKRSGASPQSPRYTSYDKIKDAKDLDGVF